MSKIKLLIVVMVYILVYRNKNNLNMILTKIVTMFNIMGGLFFSKVLWCFWNR